MPFFQVAIVEQLLVIPNDKRYDIMLRVPLKWDQPVYTAISALKGMNLFKCHMERHKTSMIGGKSYCS